MRIRAIVRPALAGLLVLCGMAAAPAQEPRLIALGGIEQGEWQLREADDHGADRMICVSDPSVLLQIIHGNAPCSRFVIENASNSTTVHYTCPTGHGRTTITVETPRLFQLKTLGVMNGAPFDYDFEGRRTGDCPARR
jgi:hypothetical protein